MLVAVNLRLVRLARGVHVADVVRRARGAEVAAHAAVSLADLGLGHRASETRVRE
jgi:hypothetical protein